MVAKVRERLAVSKPTTKKFIVEKFKLLKLNKRTVRKQYQIEITNRFSALQNLSDGEDFNRAWEKVKENIKPTAKENLGLHKLKLHKP